MMRYLMANLGLQHISSTELTTLLCVILLTCLLAGLLADLVLGSSAFGIFGNGLMLFVFFFVGLIAYNELIQQIRSSSFFLVLSYGVASAFAFTFGAAVLKNRLLHR